MKGKTGKGSQPRDSRNSPIKKWWKSDDLKLPFAIGGVSIEKTHLLFEELGLVFKKVLGLSLRGRSDGAD